MPQPHRRQDDVVPSFLGSTNLRSLLKPHTHTKLGMASDTTLDDINPALPCGP